MVGDEGRSRKARVALEKKVIWSATAGGFIVGKAARGAIPDQVGRLEAGQRRDVPITGLKLFPLRKSTSAYRILHHTLIKHHEVMISIS